MNQDALKSLDRLIDRLDRRPRRPRGRVSTAPLVLASGMVLGNLMLTRLVPAVWESLLPGGLAEADSFRGWPGLIWRAAFACTVHERSVWVVIGSALVLSLVVGSFAPPLRFLVWLAAVMIILADAGILVITLQTSLARTVAGAGF